MRLPTRRQIRHHWLEEAGRLRGILEALLNSTDLGVSGDLRHTWTELLKAPSKQSEEFAILDTLFHDTLARALGNTFLLQNLRTINERLTLFRMLDFEGPERAERTCRQHLEILNRIIAKDALARAYLKKR